MAILGSNRLKHHIPSLKPFVLKMLNKSAWAPGLCVCITLGIVGPGVISERFIAPSSKGSMCPWLQVSVKVVYWKGSMFL